MLIELTSGRCHPAKEQANNLCSYTVWFSPGWTEVKSNITRFVTSLCAHPASKLAAVSIVNIALSPGLFSKKRVIGHKDGRSWSNPMSRKQWRIFNQVGSYVFLNGVFKSSDNSFVQEIWTLEFDCNKKWWTLLIWFLPSDNIRE